MAFSPADVDRLAGATVRGADAAEVGTVGQVYVDQDGVPVWATVRTGLFGTTESFVPLDRAGFAGDDVRVPYDREVVKGAPRVEVDGELNDEETARLYDYYDGRTDGGDAVGDGTADGGAGDLADRTTGAPRGEGVAGRGADAEMTRSEERLRVGTRRVETGRARLRKHVVTEQQTVTVAVTHEEAVLVREPITDAGEAGAVELGEEEHVVVLHGEQVVTSKDVVAVERVRLGTRQVTEQQQITETVRKEQIEIIGDGDGVDGGDVRVDADAPRR